MKISVRPIGLLYICVLLGVVWLYHRYHVKSARGIGRGVSLKRLLTLSIDLAEQAGRAIARHHNVTMAEHDRRNALGLRFKNGREPITNADILSNHIITSGFSRFLASLRVISEEKPLSDLNHVVDTAAAPPHHTADAQVDRLLRNKNVYVNAKDLRVWVDPLDATQEYSDNLLEFVSVSICIAFHKQPIIGVVYFPFSKQIYWSWIGYAMSASLHRLSPAAAPSSSSSASPGSSSRENCSSSRRGAPPPPPPPRLLLSRSHVEPRILASLRHSRFRVDRFGGAPFKILEMIRRAHNASSSPNQPASFYLHPGNIRKWDVCSADVLLRSVGGRMTSLRGTTTATTNTAEEIDYAAEANASVPHGGLIGSMPHTCHDAIRAELNSVLFE